MAEYRLKKKDKQISNAHGRCLFASLFAAMAAISRKKTNPMIPHIGTGKDMNMEYGLWETVSQFSALEMAQKLR
jgi:hypothetical protein